MAEQTTTEITAIYSDFTGQPGGIGYRMDLSSGQSYTTNPDGSVLFFHNGRGDRREVNIRFKARSLRDFQSRTKSILRNWNMP